MEQKRGLKLRIQEIPVVGAIPRDGDGPGKGVALPLTVERAESGLCLISLRTPSDILSQSLYFLFFK